MSEEIQQTRVTFNCRGVELASYLNFGELRLAEVRHSPGPNGTGSPAS